VIFASFGPVIDSALESSITRSTGREQTWRMQRRRKKAGPRSSPLSGRQGQAARPCAAKWSADGETMGGLAAPPGRQRQTRSRSRRAAAAQHRPERRPVHAQMATMMKAGGARCVQDRLDIVSKVASTPAVAKRRSSIRPKSRPAHLGAGITQVHAHFDGRIAKLVAGGRSGHVILESCWNAWRATRKRRWRSSPSQVARAKVSIVDGGDRDHRLVIRIS